MTDEQLDNLVSLFDKMKNLNIDWNQVGSQLNKAKEHVSAFLGSEEGQSFLDKVKDFFSSIIDFVKSFSSKKKPASDGLFYTSNGNFITASSTERTI